MLPQLLRAIHAYPIEAFGLAVFILAVIAYAADLRRRP